MNLKISKLIFFMISVVVLVSCSGEGTEMYKNVTGKAGELVVVISQESWDGIPGKLIREIGQFKIKHRHSNQGEDGKTAYQGEIPGDLRPGFLQVSQVQLLCKSGYDMNSPGTESNRDADKGCFRA